MAFSSEITKARSEWSKIFKALGKQNTKQPRILYPEKLSFKSEKEIFSQMRKTEDICL